MADVSVKMGVSGIQQFKSAMNDAQNSIKTLDAALKLNEKQLKAGANAEKTLEQSTNLLNQKMKEQKKIADNATAALKKMDADGVAPTSKAYQDMQRRLIEAESAMLDTQQAMNSLGQTAESTAQQAGKLEQSLGGLNKKVSLQQVIDGVGAITSGMEKAAKKAEDLGKKIWENITDSARWADDAATQAMILNMNVEDYQRYKKVFDTVGEITVQEWQKAKQKVQAAIYNPTDNQETILGLLGISTHEMQNGKYGLVQGAARNFEDVFWDIGETLRAKVASGEMTQDLADTYANALFGRGFAQMNPMFALGKEGFQEALDAQRVASEEAIEANAKLNDELNKLKGDFQTLEQEVMAGLSPALTKAAETLDSLLGRLLEYLDSEEGQQALDDMAKAVEGLFEDLGNIDPEAVVQGFADVFNGIVGGLQWMVENKSTLEGILTGIVTAWGLAKLTGGALDVLNLINGLKGLNTSAVAASGAAAGASWAGAFAEAVIAAAPWVVGLYTLLNPADSDAGELNPDQQQQQEHEQAWLNEVEKELGGEEQYDKLTSGAASELREMYAKGVLADDAATKIKNLYGIGESDEGPNQNYRLIGGTKGYNITDEQAEAAERAFDAYRKLLESADKNTGETEMLETIYAEKLNKMKDLFDGNSETVNELINLMKQGAKTGAEDIFATNNGRYIFDEEGNIAGYRMPENTGESVKIKRPKQKEFINEPAEVEVEPVAVDNAAELLEAQIGTVTVPAQVVYGEEDGSYANGLWSVPFDGYRAILHKGERVVPAREVAASRNFSSNLYVESMYMNNGQDAEGLAAAIASRNKRVMAGFGS